MAATRRINRPTTLRLQYSCLGAVLLATACGSPHPDPETPPALIAHAGGIGNHRTYTNSLEALERSVARGYNAVEIDFSWTTDDHIVLLHDWVSDVPRLFDRPPGRMSLEDFRSAHSPTGLTLLALGELEPWLTENPRVLVFTDFKERNLEGLRRIADAFPQDIHRFVPQIYRPDELEAVRDLGFRNIVFTLYDSKLDDDEVVEFASRTRLFGVTMPIRRAIAGDLPTRLAAVAVSVFAHPVNDHPTVVELRRKGVAGVYTDWLSPADSDAPFKLETWTIEKTGLQPVGSRVVPFIPSSMDGLLISLVFRNEGGVSEPVEVELVDPNGTVLGSAAIDLDPGVEKRLHAVDLFPPSIDRGWVRTRAGNDVQASSSWVFRENPERHRTMESTSCSELVVRGPGTGVSGLLLALVNPTGSAHSYTLRRRIGSDLVNQEAVDLEPGHQLIRVYRSSTDETIELTVEGGPMVPLTLRWDPLVRVIE